MKAFEQLAATLDRTVRLMALVESIVSVVVASSEKDRAETLAIQSLVLSKGVRTIYASGAEFRLDRERVKTLASRWAASADRVAGPAGERGE